MEFEPSYLTSCFQLGKKVKCINLALVCVLGEEHYNSYVPEIYSPGNGVSDDDLDNLLADAAASLDQDVEQWFMRSMNSGDESSAGITLKDNTLIASLADTEEPKRLCFMQQKESLTSVLLQ